MSTHLISMSGVDIRCLARPNLRANIISACQQLNISTLIYTSTPSVTFAGEDASAAGKAYFLSNDEPITMAAMLNKILACADLPAVTQRVPAGLAYAVGVVLEGVYGILGKTEEPMMTRFVAKQLSTSHYFDISAAKTDLGYCPLVSIDQGMVKLREYLKS